VVEEAIEMNPPPPNVAVAHDWPPDLPAVLADPDQLRIVFANLVRNAREAMPQGGTLTVVGRAADGAVRVTVTDTGVGIPREHLARVMEPLYTTKARGLGLGLALARAILEKNKGSLWAESVPGEGTTFTVQLTAASC
jgi:signal transduction histidine kinase